MKRLLIAMAVCTALFAEDVIDADWQKSEWFADVNMMLSDFMTCGGPIADSNTPCNVFAAKALERIYGITDFEDLTRPNDPVNGQYPYLLANEIGGYVENDSKWTLLGSADDQTVLNEAHGQADLGRAVIAVQFTAAGPGHVAIILPGPMAMSGNWKLSCPNSASFFLNKPKSSYLGKKLSFAFSDPSKVKIYGRNFNGSI